MSANEVRNLWSNIFSNYFFLRDEFLFERPPLYGPNTTKHANGLTILYVKRFRHKLLTVIVDDRVFEAGLENTWTSTVENLTRQMNLDRMEMSENAQLQDTFGIAMVGLCSRFYVLRPGESRLIPHPETGGETLEFKDHEPAIVRALLSMRAAASAIPRSPRPHDNEESDNGWPPQWTGPAASPLRPTSRHSPG